MMVSQWAYPDAINKIYDTLQRTGTAPPVASHSDNIAGRNVTATGSAFLQSGEYDTQQQPSTAYANTNVETVANGC